MRIQTSLFHQSALFRITSALAVAPLLLAGFPAMQPAAAQPAMPQPGATQPYAVAATADPPARVGRLARIHGTVSFHAAGQTQWDPATLNYPLTGGDAFWTEPGASAELEVEAVHMALDQSTEFAIDTLDDRTLAATLAQGEVYLRIRGLRADSVTQLRTPRGLVTITQAGRYEIGAGDTEHPTTLTVVEGAAQVTGAGIQLAVGPHQTVQISGADNFQAATVAEADDAFLAARLAEERPPPAPRAAPPPVVAQMTGGDALEEVGEWAPNPQYGEVWYPPVQADWVPYRHGHWAYVAPWGWTWVDDAAWGFAPFHYGRWVQVGPRWGWIASEPGIAYDAYRPIYSPALVSFVGIGAGVAVGLGAAAAVGWIPLGPREAYYPPYRTSADYVRNINRGNVNNGVNLGSVPPATRSFANRGAATVVPAAAMAGSQPIAGRSQAVNPQALAAVRPVQAPGVQPTRGTLGVTPAVARQLNLPAGAPGPALPQRPAAPGPAVQQVGAGAVPLRPPGGFRGTPASLANPAAPPPAAAPSALLPSAASPVAPAPTAGAIAPRGGPGSASPGNAALPALRPSMPAGAPPSPAQPPLAMRPPGPQPGQAPAGPVGSGPANPGAVVPGRGNPQLAAPGTINRNAAAPFAPAPHPPQAVVPGGPAVAPQHLAAPQGLAAPPAARAALPPAAAPPPQALHAPPPIARVAPPPQAAPPVMHAPPPAQAAHVAPPPQAAHVAPPPQPAHVAAPPPQVAHVPAAPPPQAAHVPAAPPPQAVHAAPPPPAPRAAPPQAAEHRACPPGRPTC